MTEARQPVVSTLHLVGAAGCAHPVILLTMGDDIAYWACRDCRARFSPAMPAPEPQRPASAVDEPTTSEYLSVRDLARRIPYTEGTIRNLMSQGRLRLGVHYVRPSGRGGRVMFKLSAVLAWLDGREPEA